MHCSMSWRRASLRESARQSNARRTHLAISLRGALGDASWSCVGRDESPELVAMVVTGSAHVVLGTRLGPERE
jgi:hypothetical protein